MGLGSDAFRPIPAQQILPKRRRQGMALTVKTPLESWRFEAVNRGVQLPEEAASWARQVDTPDEMVSQVSLYARKIAEEGAPLSGLLTQLRCLSGSVDVGLLMTVAADAHTVGTATRVERHLKLRLRSRLPVFPLDERRILVCAAGPVDGELLDTLLGRGFALAAGRGSKELWLDVSGSYDLSARVLEDTLRGFPRHDLAGQLQVVLCGVDEDWWQARLQDLGLLRWIRTDSLYNR